MSYGTEETGIFHTQGDEIALTAGEDITLGRLVKLGSTDSYVLMSDAGEKAIGVALRGQFTKVSGATEGVVSSGKLVTVRTRGIFNLVASGTVTVNDTVQSGTDGIVATLSISSTADISKIVGVAITTATSGNAVKIRLSGISLG